MAAAEMEHDRRRQPRRHKDGQVASQQSGLFCTRYLNDKMFDIVARYERDASRAR